MLKMEKFVTANGQEHGLLEEVANQITKEAYAKFPEKTRKELEARDKRNAELVKVTYMHRTDEVNGKWEGWDKARPGEPLRMFRFFSGHSYIVPRGLKESINKLGTTPLSGILDKNGVPTPKDGSLKRYHLMVEGE